MSEEESISIAVITGKIRNGAKLFHNSVDEELFLSSNLSPFINMQILSLISLHRPPKTETLVDHQASLGSETVTIQPSQH